MNALSQLGEIFKKAQAKKGKGFREEAAELLKSFPLPDVGELLTEIASHPLPQQNFGPVEFGEPSVTLFTDGEIALDLYYWKNSNISIHSHNFEGAFKLLLGKSFEQTFEFRDRKELYPGMSEGNLVSLEKETILPGVVRPIDSEDRFIHSIFHVESPSITLTLRTINNPRPLFIYLYPDLEIEMPKERVLELTKKIQLLKVISPDKYPQFSDLEISLLYIYGSEELPLKEQLLKTPHGKKIMEACESDRNFQKKCRSLLRTS